MKYFKYIVMALAVAFVATSCDKKDPDFNSVHPTSDQAEVQVFYMAPLQNVAANYVHAIYLNEDKHENNGAALMNTYNGAPGGQTGTYWTVSAGDVRVRLLKAKAVTEKILDWEKPILEDGTRNEKDTTYYEYEPFYDRVVSNVEGGKKYYLVVYDLNQAPMIIDQQEPPTQVTTNTAEYASVRLLNFMWEDANNVYEPKLQLRLQDTQTKEYENVGDPIGFGEATEWFMPSVIKTTFNSGGTQRRDLDLVDTSTGERLQVLNSKGVAYGFTDYWTLSIGRGYTWIIYGTRNSTLCPVAIRSWTIR